MSLLLFNAGKCTASLLLSRARVHSKFTLNVSACRLHFYKWHKCQFSASCGATQEVLFIVCARARAPLVRWNGGREREREKDVARCVCSIPSSVWLKCMCADCVKPPHLKVATLHFLFNSSAAQTIQTFLEI